MSAGYVCDVDLRRRQAIAAGLNGIEYVEVLDREAPAGSPRQRTLLVRCLKELSTDPLVASVIARDRARDVTVTWMLRATEVDQRPPELVLTPDEVTFFKGAFEPGRVLWIRTDHEGDFSTYTLRLTSPGGGTPVQFDPLLSECGFSFKAECANEIDCEPYCACPPQVKETPPIDYLAKDYASFRRLMLDRMSELVPSWTERNPADLGVAVIETLAYVADHLSYQQDAIATEAYLHTARRRESVRRHARLLDYFMHEGCNARVWVQVLVNGDTNAEVPRHTPVTTAIPGSATHLPAESDLIQDAREVFLTMEPLTGVFAKQQEIRFYTWKNEECCLPAGATTAVLDGDIGSLVRGRVLIFEEVRGPKSGNAADANPAHRHAVRLIADAKVETDPVSAAPITRIEWGVEDALPFPLCVSARAGGKFHPDVSVARGNIVLADHGRWVKPEQFPPVPDASLRRVLDHSGRCGTAAMPLIPSRFRPRLSDGPLSHAAPHTPPVDPDTGAVRPARADAVWPLADARADVYLLDQQERRWNPQRDLLGSEPVDTEFVAEIENDGRASIRFGDDRHGLRPPARTEFTAHYRVGNGLAGNVGARSLTTIFTDTPHVIGAANPMAARGGTEPESIADVQRRAPSAFTRQERAVTEDDYALMTRRTSGVQGASARFRWTGSWHTVFVAVDPLAGVRDTPALATRVTQDLERYRMAGHDTAVEVPRFVALDIELHVCVAPGYFRHQVRQVLDRMFTSGRQPNGMPGLFHPDRFGFGQPVYLSVLLAAAQSVDGVQSIQVMKFRRYAHPQDPGVVDYGVIPITAGEVARLDNDPSVPGQGTFTLTIGGGQ